MTKESFAEIINQDKAGNKTFDASQSIKFSRFSKGMRRNLELMEETPSDMYHTGNGFTYQESLNQRFAKHTEDDQDYFMQEDEKDES